MITSILIIILILLILFIFYTNKKTKLLIQENNNLIINSEKKVEELEVVQKQLIDKVSSLEIEKNEIELKNSELNEIIQTNELLNSEKNIKELKIIQKQLIDKVSSLEIEKNEIELKNSELNEIIQTNELLNSEKNIKELKIVQKKLVDEINTLEENLDLINYGFYNLEYKYPSSFIYKEKLIQIREKQKEMIKNREAAICSKEWTIEGSKVRGKKMMNNYLKIILRAFNGEADAAISSVEIKNYFTLEKRIYKSREILNKLAEDNHCEITSDYFKSKIQEFKLKYEYNNKLEDEKEEQRLIKEQIREEERAKKECDNAIEEAQSKELKYQKALEEAKKEYDIKSEEEKTKFAEKIKQLEIELETIKSIKERAISQAQLTKSGYVYIISNIGSFGENIYKIGMTRRLEPEDRVKELSGASVPFPFDIHAMIYTENAPALENLLHKNFNSKRVNLINQRREFFNICLDEIEEFIVKNYGEFKLTKLAQAEQYRQSLVLKNEQIIPSYDENLEISDEIEEVF
ncbi:MAG: DUF4041 domain-containing protein [Cetobacterium sp.]